MGDAAGQTGAKEKARRARPGLRSGPSRTQAKALALAAALFLVLGVAVYGPALEGPFVSDDRLYIVDNPYVRSLDGAGLRAILDPFGPAALLVSNYSPAHLLAHALEWKLFGTDVRGYHLVNVALHALCATLLLALLVRSGLAKQAAAAGALFFLLHPANVEAVAWISQLKTSASLLCLLASWWFYPRRPDRALFGFALGLAVKPTAAAALFVFAADDWVRRGRLRRRWLAAGAGLLALYAWPELWVQGRSGFTSVAHPGLVGRLWPIAGFAGRYLAMAIASIGVSAYHQPGWEAGLADPWCWLGLVGLFVLGGRSARALRARLPEAPYWTLAAISFAPVSQLFPFTYPIADRYLYFVLPGLIGGVLLAGQHEWPRLRRRLGGRADRANGRRGELGAAAVALVLVVALGMLGLRARARASLWANPSRLVLDGARHYPEGLEATLLRARHAAELGDREAALRALERAYALGFRRFERLLGDPALASLRADPRFEQLVRSMARFWIERAQSLHLDTAYELLYLARAYRATGDVQAARAALERAAKRDDPFAAIARRELHPLEREDR